MSGDISWPKKGNKAFASASEGAYFHMPSISSFHPPHADAFRTAAEIIIDKCEADGDCPSNDTLFFPVAYLYRHCIELRLKAIIRVGLGMRFFKNDEVEEDLKQHNLIRLWKHTKKLLIHRWPTADKSPLKGTESAIQEFHQSDPNGQMFRYDNDNDGRRYKHEKLPDHISPAQMRKTTKGVCNFLEATWSELKDNLSYMLQGERDSY